MCAAQANTTHARGHVHSSMIVVHSTKGSGMVHGLVSWSMGARPVFIVVYVCLLHDQMNYYVIKNDPTVMRGFQF